METDITNRVTALWIVNKYYLVYLVSTKILGVIGPNCQHQAF